MKLYALFIFFLDLYISPATSHTSCGGFFNAKDGGEVTTPNYPRQYERNLSCIWILKAPKGYVVELVFLDMGMDNFYEECLTDELHVRDGNTSNSPSLGLVLCGERIPEVVTSTRQYMFLNFTSSGISERGRGFRAKYYIVAEHKWSCINNLCGGVIEDVSSCRIQSPGYPGSFQSSLNCSWLIRAPQPSQTISFWFNQLDLDETDSLCEHNSVTLHDGANETAPIIHDRFCDLDHNRLKDIKISSTGPFLYISLRTTTSSPEDEKINGFSARYEVIDSSSTGSTPLNVLSSSKNVSTQSSTIAGTTLTTKQNTVTKETLVSVTKGNTITRTKAVTSDHPYASSEYAKNGNSPRLQTTVSEANSIIQQKTPLSDSDTPWPETTESEANCTIQQKTPLPDNRTVLPGLVIGVIVVIVILILAVTVMILFYHWKKRNERLNRTFREADVQSDINALLSSKDSVESVKKLPNSIERRIETQQL